MTSSATSASQAALEHDLTFFTRSLFFPLMLMLNFSCFQYLMLLFHARWREKRVLLLLFISAISVVTLVPFATQSDDTAADLNDVSESCLALMLLVQTALVGTKHAPKGKLSRANSSASKLGVLANLTLLQLFADVLILFDCVVVVLGLVCVFKPHVAIEFGGTIVINNVAENVTLAFTFVYRFGALGREKGWRRMVRDDKWEIACHVVFMMHEYPFILLESLTHVSWEYLQAIFMRLALTPCVWMTIGEHHAQRVSVFFSLQKASGLSDVNLKELVRTASLVAAAGGTGAREENELQSRASVKSSAVIDATGRDEQRDADENPVEAEQIEVRSPMAANSSPTGAALLAD